MITYELTSHQSQVKEVVHWFAENEMRPISMVADQLKKVPDDWLSKITVSYTHLTLPTKSLV